MEIVLSKFGSTFSSRPTAHKILDPVITKESQVLIVNFEGTKEVSPSFCHELLNIVINERKLKIKIINANDSIKFQLKKAIASLDIKKRI